jgi:small subunit ribosomal protein S24e
MIVDVFHPGRAPLAKNDVREHVAKLYKADAKQVIVYSFKTVFGGAKSSGFANIYDSTDALKKFEPRHRLLRIGEGAKKTRSRKQWKDLKKKRRVTWGTGRREAARAAKKAAES